MPKTFLGKLIAAIGRIFTGLYNEAKKTYNKLPQETKDALFHGAGLTDIINSMLDDAPEKIRAAIAEKYPAIPFTQLEAALSILVVEMGGKYSTLESGIKFLQDKLRNAKGKNWANTSRFIASGLASVFAPKETKFEAIASLIGMVYHWLVKK